MVNFFFPRKCCTTTTGRPLFAIFFNLSLSFGWLSLGRSQAAHCCRPTFCFLGQTYEWVFLFESGPCPKRVYYWLGCKNFVLRLFEEYLGHNFGTTFLVSQPPAVIIAIEAVVKTAPTPPIPLPPPLSWAQAHSCKRFRKIFFLDYLTHK